MTVFKKPLAWMRAALAVLLIASMGLPAYAGSPSTRATVLTQPYRIPTARLHPTTGKFLDNPRVVSMGDSITHFNLSAPVLSTTAGRPTPVGSPIQWAGANGGEYYNALALLPKFRWDNWFDAAEQGVSGTGQPSRLSNGSNQGISGDTPLGVYGRIVKAMALKPDILVVSAGTNTTSDTGNQPARVAELMGAIDYAHAVRPGMKVIVTNVRGLGPTQISLRGGVASQQAFNTALATAMSQRSWASSCDVYGNAAALIAGTETVPTGYVDEPGSGGAGLGAYTAYTASKSDNFLTTMLTTANGSFDDVHPGFRGAALYGGPQLAACIGEYIDSSAPNVFTNGWGTQSAIGNNNRYLNGTAITLAATTGNTPPGGIQSGSQVPTGWSVYEQAAVKASKAVSFTAVPADGDTLVLNGQTITFRTGTAGAGEVQVTAGNVATTLTSLASFITTGANTYLMTATSTGTSGSGTLTLSAQTAGVAGNSLTTTESSSAITTITGTLAGGTQPFLGLTVSTASNTDNTAADAAAKYIQVAVTPAGSNLSEAIGFRPSGISFATPTNLQGKWVQAYAEIEVDGCICWQWVNLNIQPNGVSPDVWQMGNNVGITGKGIGGTRRFWVTTPNFIWPVGATTVSPSIVARINPSTATGTPTVRFRQMGIIETPPPANDYLNGK